MARRLTEAAARACAPWIGRGDKEAADAAAVAALEETARADDLNGRVVIGEGEKDDAPYLEPGTVIGAEANPPVDIAVDPLEGTSLVAHDAPGALSVLALTPADALLPLGRAFYMEKRIGPPGLARLVDLDASPRRVVAAVAEGLDIAPTDVRVAVQDRPRHAGLIEALRDAGAQVHLFDDGDLSFAILALQPRSDLATGAPAATPSIDLLWGIGGAPEGMLAAIAQRALGGSMHARLAPRSESERTRLHDDPALPNVLDRSFTAADLAGTDTVAMTLTGITDGPLLTGIRSANDGQKTETLILTSSRSYRKETTHKTNRRPDG